MRLRIVLVLLLVSPLFLRAQDVFKGEHFIEVTGNAQTEIEPNEIDVQIRLREFEENKKKTSLENLDKDFFNALKEAGIDRKRAELADAGAKLDKLTKKEKDAFREKTYQIKVTSASELEKLLTQLEPVKTDLVDIVRISHSDLPKLKLDLKVKALQAAKAKAEVLLKSIGAEAGKPLMIRDWEVDPVQPVMNMKANWAAEGGIAADNATTEFKKIKLQSQIMAQFEIK